MSDSQLILSYLQRFPGWHLGPDMSRDLKPGVNSWAYRTRISCDLNRRILPKMGLHIESRLSKSKVAEYRLVKVDTSSQDWQETSVKASFSPSKPISVVWDASGQGEMFSEAI